MSKVTSLLPVHPGEILAEEFMVPLDISVDELARDIRVSPALVSDILAGRAGISAESAMRLGRYFSTSYQMWLNLQKSYDMHHARIEHAQSLAQIRLMEERKVPPTADILRLRR
ncbi:HigA family addiction module antitoxin [Stenotrophomonas sp. PS02289]|uniref:HigA family addiction module antitoxin n=1 Tax=Stenotrophomonas sp. PS02289 TaxID=2991422 RepID=UPI00249B602B|nr:HigA family addiction module antitoxin [Stenotrophomonas sp. PS02289]